jgi:hypothetical protein
VSIITGPPGPRPETLMDSIKGPLLILWGDKDPFTPVDGPVGRFLKDYSQTREECDFISLPGKHGEAPKSPSVTAQMSFWSNSTYVTYGLPFVHIIVPQCVTACTRGALCGCVAMCASAGTCESSVNIHVIVL